MYTSNTQYCCVLQAAAQYEAIMRVLEEERDYYRTEYEALKASKRSSARATPTKVGCCRA